MNGHQSIKHPIRINPYESGCLTRDDIRQIRQWQLESTLCDLLVVNLVSNLQYRAEGPLIYIFARSDQKHHLFTFLFHNGNDY